MRTAAPVHDLALGIDNRSADRAEKRLRRTQVW